ncbi:MAG: LarC family nickel insertion protein, partial [Methanobacterium sp.]|nr:LarC family nickel insertion protein [Methanobacterium sp.]
RTMELGANNIHVLNAITKKGRMEYIVLVDVEEKLLDDICSLLALEFGTLGIKTFKYDHVKFPYKLESKVVTFKSNDINLKSQVRIKYVKKDEHQIISLKAEYEDVQSIAESLNLNKINIPLSKLKTIIEAECYRKVLKEEDIVIRLQD